MAGDRASAAAGRIARGAVAHRRCGVSRTGGRRVLAFKRCLVARSARGCVSNDFETRTAHEAKRGAEEDREEVARYVSATRWLATNPPTFFHWRRGPPRRELTLMPRGGPRDMAAGASDLFGLFGLSVRLGEPRFGRRR